MTTARPRPPNAPPLLRPLRDSALAHARGPVPRSRPARIFRDPFLLYTTALAPVALIVVLVSRQPRDLAIVAVLSPICVVVQLLLGAVPARARPFTAAGWSFLRLAVAFLFVAGLAELVGGPTHPLLALYLPVVVAAAVLGTTQAAVIGALSALIFTAPELAQPGSHADVALRGLTLAGASVLIAVGTRRLVIAVERAGHQMRTAMVAERRRSRQIAGMEAVSRLLVSGGPTVKLLDGALGVLVDQFHYRYVSIYIHDRGGLRLGAQRGYEHPREWFDGTAGVVGRVMRTHELAFVADVTADPDYIVSYDGVISEICAPLTNEGEFLGVLNVEALQSLDRTDRDLVATLAGRIATVVALGRDRQALAERAAVLRSLNEFTHGVSGELDLHRLGAALVDGVRRVVPADIVTLTVLERETGRYLLRAATDLDPSALGREIRPGDGLAGRAIRDRTLVFDDNCTFDWSPASRPDTPETMALLGAGIPLAREGVVVGAIAMLRRDRTQVFQPIETEAMALMGGHAALAISNAFLHAEVEELAIRDALTGLYNRRYFDEALARVVATWRRSLRDAQRPVAAIMFDIDHFGEFNRQHGHQVGDDVLRAFARVLLERFRLTDLVARFGGEEFVVILEGATRADAVQVAEEVRVSLADRAVLGGDGARLVVTVSAGCAEIDEAEPTGEQLLRTADVGLMMAKRAGRNRVVAA